MDYKKGFSLILLVLLVVVFLTAFVACDKIDPPTYDIYIPDNLTAAIFRDPETIKLNLESHGYEVIYKSRRDTATELFNVINWTLVAKKNGLQQLEIIEYLENKDAIDRENTDKVGREQNPDKYKYYSFGRIGRVYFIGIEDAVEAMSIRKTAEDAAEA